MARHPVQLSLRFRAFTLEDEKAALDWWSNFITAAELLTHNPKAEQNPTHYRQAVKARIQTDEVVEGVYLEWKEAQRTGTLAKPLWAAPKRKVMRIGHG